MPLLGHARKLFGSDAWISLTVKNTDAFPAFPLAAPNSEIRPTVFMAARAMCTRDLSGTDCHASQDVNAVRDSLKVFRVNACRIAAQVVNVKAIWDCPWKALS
jgi:hypothetical protein